MRFIKTIFPISFLIIIIITGCTDYFKGEFVEDRKIEGTTEKIAESYEVSIEKKPTTEQHYFVIKVLKTEQLQYQVIKKYREMEKTSAVGNLFKYLLFPVTLPLSFMGVVDFDQVARSTNNLIDGEIEEKKEFTPPTTVNDEIIISFEDSGVPINLQNGFASISLVNDLKLVEFYDPPALIFLKVELKKSNEKIGEVMLNPLEWTRPYFIASERVDIVNDYQNKIVIVGSLSKNEKAEILAEENNLYKVKKENYSGFISVHKGYKKYFIE